MAVLRLRDVSQAPTMDQLRASQSIKAMPSPKSDPTNPPVPPNKKRVYNATGAHRVPVNTFSSCPKQE